MTIPVGFLGAWAFNPDSGFLLHDELLWRIFGISCEVGPLVLLLVVLLAAVTGARRERR